MQRRGGSGQPVKGQRHRTIRPKTRKAPTAPASADHSAEQFDRLKRERDEALEQLAATAEILSVISSSPTDTQPVFDCIVQSGLKLFPNALISVALRDGDTISVAAIADADPDRAEAWRRTWPIPLRVDYFHGAAILDCRIVDIPDVKDAPAEFAAGARNFLTSGYRAITIMPMMRSGEAIGLLSVVRLAPGPLSDKQLAVLRTFAAQAVIAIENTRLLGELRESLQQQTATADVLKVISRSTFDLQGVLDTLAQSAVSLCEADQAVIRQRVGDSYPVAATCGFTQRQREHLERYSPKPGRGSVFGRAIVEGRTVHIPDVAADPEWERTDQSRVSGIRAAVGVPLLREGVIVGILVVIRTEPRAFSQKQIELLETFADQAVIAIENVRLFDEVQARTRELSESLQQQTATADVLKAISRSAFDLKTVLDALVEAAARLCEADQGTIARERDGVYQRVATYGFSDDFKELVRNLPVKPERGTATGRALLEGKVVHIPDVRADPDYTFADAQKLGGFRTILSVPMLREGTPIGVLALTRHKVRPFTDKQIELVQTFADQAAIAIENVRLFESVETRTRELAASLEDLRTTQDRLVQTQKLASLGQLTAGIAHEIKNPLNFVNNFSGVSTELIDELDDALGAISIDQKARAEITELTRTLRGNLDKVVQHGKRADAIVKNMLQHSREGSGEHRPVDINALVEESLNLAYHGARAEKREFDVLVEQSLDPAAGKADLFPQEITRVLLNLISNGVYATAKKAQENGEIYKPTLTATTKNLGDRVEIRIRDNGTGISPDVKEKMFNPFFTTKPAGEGTGLGLSISHDIIVKQHGGSIEVDTQPGEFTEIRIILPRAAVFQPGVRI